MAFNIGDRVCVRVWDDPCNGFSGDVVDIMYSTARRENIYRVSFDNADKRTADFTEAELELIKEDTVNYRFKTDVAEDNVVIVIMYEDHEDGSSKEIGRGHGHIIHEGALGIAQATSYAMYRLYKRLEENNL